MPFILRYLDLKIIHCARGHVFVLLEHTGCSGRIWGRVGSVVLQRYHEVL